MLVEFVGCSGAGKSTLCRRVCAHLQGRSLSVVEPLDLVLGPRMARVLAPRRWSNALFETAGHRWIVAGRHRFADTRELLDTWIAASSKSARERTRLRRSCDRKLAVMCGARQRAGSSQVVVIDEGIVHLAHVLLGRIEGWRRTELDRYLTCAPLPDLVIHIRAPFEEIERRLAVRRRQPLPDRGPTERRRFLEQSLPIFEQVARHRRLQSRMVMIDNDKSHGEALDRLAQTIARHIVQQHAREAAHHVATILGARDAGRLPRAEFAETGRPVVHAA